MDDLHVVSEGMSFDNAKELHIAGNFCDLVGMLSFLCRCCRVPPAPTAVPDHAENPPTPGLENEYRIMNQCQHVNRTYCSVIYKNLLFLIHFFSAMETKLII